MIETIPDAVAALPPDLRACFDSLAPAHRRAAEHVAAFKPDRLESWVRRREEQDRWSERWREAIESAPPIPDLTPTQSAFVASLAPTHRAAFDALDGRARARLLELLPDCPDPILFDEAMRLLKPPAEAPPWVAPESSSGPDPGPPKARRRRPKVSRRRVPM